MKDDGFLLQVVLNFDGGDGNSGLTYVSRVNTNNKD